jgi:hypothetical protein
MVSWYRRLIPAIAAICLLLGTGSVAHAVSDEEAVLIPGATVFKQINPLFPLFERFFYPKIGVNFHDDDEPEVIDYSQNAFAADRAIREGVAKANVAVREIDGRVVVIGESMGSMVASRLAAKLAVSSDPPAVDDIRFVLLAPPEAGIAEYFKQGTFIPILNYRVSRVPESPYPTTVVIGEYDGWADPPDRPWNLVSLLNAALGAAFVHTPTSLADWADVPAENITVEQNSKGATVTTYLVPTENLPLTMLLRLVVPDALVDILDQVLRPIVDAGYRRHDEPGDRRPYLSEGRIRCNVEWQRPEVPSEAAALESIAPSGAASTSAPLLSAPVSTSAGRATDAAQDDIDTSGVTGPMTSTKSSGGSTLAPVDATQLVSEAAESPDVLEAVSTEPEVAAQDPPADTGDSAEDAIHAVGSESAESEVATGQDAMETAPPATGTATEERPTRDGSPLKGATPTTRE